MNILVIAPTPYFSDRGCHIRILEEVTALKRAGHSPIIYTYHLGRDEGNVPIYRTPRVRWYSKTEAGPSWHKLYIDLLLLWKIIRTARQHSFDVIHAHLHEGAWIGWWVKLWLKIPLILDAQGSLVGEVNTYGFFSIPGLKSVFKAVEKWIIHRVDYIFTSSRAAYEFITDTFPASRDKISELTDAVSIPIFKNTHPVPGKTPIIMYTGGLSSIKGIDYLLEAMPVVLQSYPTAKFRIIGYPEIDRCKKIVRSLGVEESVEFLGRVNYFELPNYLQSATVAVDPKPSGAFEASGKLLNYMSVGLPIVAFDSVNTRDMLKDTGYLVKTESAQALAQGIISLLNRPTEMARLGILAAKRIHEHYSWDKRITIATEVYEQLSHKK